jgi:L-histidine N-alpha-methyltransferase
MNAALEYSRHKAIGDDVVAGVIDGLQRTPKEIAPVWLYDDLGSRLFDAICESPEYYPTRTETKIMVFNGAEMAQCLGPNVALIEFGSGSSFKTRILLDRLQTPDVYVPIDISRAQLLDAASAIARDYPWLRVLPICADFTQPLRLPERIGLAKRNVVYFPGSTIGNFEHSAAREMLQSMRDLAGRNGAVLIGVDLRKEGAVLERAYNDAQGITAQFNLNVLRHLNRETGSDFHIAAFEHRAVWVESLGRIEMRLVSRCRQRVHIGDHVVELAQGEFIRTECSHKYTLDSFAELAASAGLRVQKVWCDPDNLFSVQLLRTL